MVRDMWSVAEDRSGTFEASVKHVTVVTVYIISCK